MMKRILFGIMCSLAPLSAQASDDFVEIDLYEGGSVRSSLQYYLDQKADHGLNLEHIFEVYYEESYHPAALAMVEYIKFFHQSREKEYPDFWKSIIRESILPKLKETIISHFGITEKKLHTACRSEASKTFVKEINSNLKKLRERK